MDSQTRLAIVGAGPTGLEAALLAARAGVDFRLLEAAPEVAGNVRRWGHVRLFSPWALDVSPAARGVLREAGTEPPDGDDCPTGDELVGRVLEPLAALPAITERLRLGRRVVAVGRDGLVKPSEIGTERRARAAFRLLIEEPDGRERTLSAEVVLDCSGSLHRPLWLGNGGIPAPGERALGARIVRSLPDLEREAGQWAGRTILLVGAGHSAQTAASTLARIARDQRPENQPATRIVWLLRRARPEIEAMADDPLPERARLNRRALELIAGEDPAIEALCGATVEALAPTGDGLIAVDVDHAGARRQLRVDRILSLVGAVGDHHLYRELHVHECYATSGPMNLAAQLLGETSADCLAQGPPSAEVLVNPEPRFYILGSKSYGRNSAFLMRAGWEQVREVFALEGWG